MVACCEAWETIHTQGPDRNTQQTLSHWTTGFQKQVDPSRINITQTGLAQATIFSVTHSIISVSLNVILGAGKMTQRLRSLAISPEDPGLVSSTHVKCQILGTWHSPDTSGAQKPTQAYTHTQTKINLSKKIKANFFQVKVNSLVYSVITLTTAFSCWKQQCNPSCVKINLLSYDVNQVGLKCVIPLPQPPKGWGSKCVPPCVPASRVKLKAKHHHRGTRKLKYGRSRGSNRNRIL